MPARCMGPKALEAVRAVAWDDPDSTAMVEPLIAEVYRTMLERVGDADDGPAKARAWGVGFIVSALPRLARDAARPIVERMFSLIPPDMAEPTGAAQLDDEVVVAWKERGVVVGLAHGRTSVLVQFAGGGEPRRVLRSDITSVRGSGA